MGRSFTPKRVVSGIMLLVSFTCVAVQYNDPDGVLWMVVYAYAVGVSALGVFGRFSPLAYFGAVVYLLLGIWVMPWAELDANLFGVPKWHMGPDSNEEAREAAGLFLLSIWMFVVTWWWWAARPAEGGSSADTPA